MSSTQRISSGIDPIDSAWDGLFKGGRYLVYGKNSDGRSHLALLFTAEATRHLQTSLLITGLRTTDLHIQASSLAFDIESASRSGILRVSRIPSELELIYDDDETVESALKSLSNLIVDASADRVVIDDFSPYTHLSSFTRFRTAFIRLLSEIEHVGSTLLIAMPEPANEASRRMIEFMGTLMTGSIHVHVSAAEGPARRTLTLQPQIGHITAHVAREWNLDRIVAKSELTAAAPLANDRFETASTTAAETPEPEITEQKTDGVIAPEDGVTMEEAADAIEPPDVEAEFESPEETPEPVLETTSEGLTLTVVDETRGQVFDDRGRFAEELQLYFEDFESDSTSFTLVAMRMEDPKDPGTSSDFHVITSLINETLGPQDTVYADETMERIVVLLGEGSSEDAQGLFARLKARLRISIPDRADHLMNAVSAVVVVNGKPFGTADEFLRYVLEDVE